VRLDHDQHVGREPPGLAHEALFFLVFDADGHGGNQVGTRGQSIVPRGALWYKARRRKAMK